MERRPRPPLDWGRHTVSMLTRAFLPCHKNVLTSFSRSLMKDSVKAIIRAAYHTQERMRELSAITRPLSDSFRSCHDSTRVVMDERSSCSWTSWQTPWLERWMPRYFVAVSWPSLEKVPDHSVVSAM